ncbi:ThiF family adenylyltransferase [Desulfovibrio mangrovi]|uniref:ThiF family adenylyltransferase n=1 Tax=Desulfovibrio mangrovi TaxID=2976983 RepID=UPI0022458B13|nr:ThiF family adenylyltransferase [Desulfovibrio mangrovi]UZP67568.1 ThiF family adenylyltransferase [Desulfovibrio mangrovi]
MPDAGTEARKKLSSQGLDCHGSYVDAAFCRNLGLVDYAGQQKLHGTRIAIAGLGGVGGVHLMTLARTGIGAFNLADMDSFSVVNVNRQFGATLDSFGRPKLDVMVELARSVNPCICFKTFPDGISDANLDDFLKGVDIVVDGIDFFAFDIRRRLFKRAHDLGIPVITAGPLGFSTAVLVFMPDGMGFDEYFDINDTLPEMHRYLHFAMGLAPRATHLAYLDRQFVNIHEKRGPSLHLACQLCAAMAATEVVRIVLGKGRVRAVPCYAQFDPYAREFRKGRLLMGNRNPLQRLKIAVAKKLFLGGGGREGLVVPPVPSLVQRGEPVPANAVEYVMRAGMQAPSGDNVQPWRFLPFDGGIDVALHTEADHSFFNYDQIASLVACGAAVENMRLAAAATGLGPTVTLVPQPAEQSSHPVVARVEFSPDGQEREDVLHSAMWRRCTNRNMFGAKPLPHEVCDRLSGMVAQAKSGFDDIRLHWVTGKSERKALARAIFLADRIRVERRDLHEYFMSMVRFEKPSQKYGDGLPLKNLCAGLAGEQFLKLVRPWTAMRIANMAGVGRLMPMHSALGIMRSGGAGLLTIGKVDMPSILQGGQAIERVWIMLEHMGFAFQPMTAITLFRLREMLEGDGAFSELHRGFMKEAWGIVSALFPEANGRIPLMLFRTGRGPRLRYGTYRRELHTLMLQR